MASRFNPVFADRPTTIFAVMSALANKHGAINLGQGFPDEDGPHEVLQKAADAIMRGPNQYVPTTGLPELQKAIAEANKRFYGLDIDPAIQVLITAGAVESLASAFMGFLKKGDEAILFAPFYDCYGPQIEAVGATPVVVPLSPPHWTIDEKKLRAAISPNTRLIAINTPHNPTGHVISDAELEIIAKVAIEHDLIVVCDEVYEHLIFDGKKHNPLMTMPGMLDRCVRIGSAGKTFSVTGWRIGYTTGPAHLIDVMAKTHQFMSYTIQPHLQEAVAYGLGLPDQYYADFTEDMQAKRDVLVEGLRDVGFEVIPAEGTYFLTVNIRDVGFEGTDVEFAEEVTEKAGVTTIPISAFYMPNDPNTPYDYVRFCFCKNPKVLREAAARLKKYFA